MKKHLTDQKIGIIVQIIDGWTGKLTWNLLIAKVEPVCGLYSRQGLEKHSRIKSAFNSRKSHVRNERGSSIAHLSDVEAKLLERLERVEAENRRLTKENNDLLGQFVRWQYNASAKGLAENNLNAALPSIDRELTSARKPKKKVSGMTNFKRAKDE
ncbi:hypothetical protein [Puniceibacterium sediminis]|uniref:Uncharacterized protein n=1 Tax=Puniceibacterium sediminis TaxID=1608407 RepID=A0A238VZH2_9RHOB|nr:hypothetical protein [Puniceibacterium sediminis]SNR39745.1 hypothetical protein SAMN06265370_1045 [Puniceibacterium sediminis]